MNKFLSLVSLSVVLFFSACQKESDENIVNPVEKPASAPKAPTGRVTGITAATDLFVLGGDNLYRVSATTRQATLIGSGWSGTEALTVNPYTNSVYGVQADHLWKVNLSNGAVLDYGPRWGGTEAITNSGEVSRVAGEIYAVQGGSLWGVSAVENRFGYKLGNGNWTGTVDMSYDLAYSHIVAIQGNVMWSTRPPQGTYVRVNSHLDFTGTVAYVYTGWHHLYVRAGRLWKNGAMLGTADWTGTQAITYAGNYMWIVKNSVVYQVDYDNGNVIATVPGITNAYGVESYECK